MNSGIVKLTSETNKERNQLENKSETLYFIYIYK